MKKSLSVFMAACFLWVVTFQTSCIGSFGLTGKVYNWNKDMDKFVGELVFLVFIILPVYSIALFIDAVILNLIEFWSGSNPVAMQEGDIETQVVVAEDGNTYEMTATKNRFDIVQLTGKKAGEKQSLIYNPEEKSWSHEKGDKVAKLAQFSEDGQFVNVFGPEGQMAAVPAGITDKNLAREMVEDQFASQTAMK